MNDIPEHLKPRLDAIIETRRAGASIDQLARDFGAYPDQMRAVIKQIAPELLGRMPGYARRQSPLTTEDHQKWLRENCVRDPREARKLSGQAYGGSSLGDVE